MQAAYVPNSLCPLPAVCPARVTHEDAAALSWSPSLNVSVSSSSPPGTHNLNLPASDVFEKLSHTVRYPHVWLQKHQGGNSVVVLFWSLTSCYQLVTISSMWMCLCLQVPMNPIAHQVLYLCVRVSVPISVPQWELLAHLLSLSFQSQWCVLKGSVSVCLSACCVSSLDMVWWAVYICHISQSLAVICVI